MIRRKIAVDVRMIEASGIGTYLQNLLPRIIAKRPDWQFYLIGDSIIIQKHNWSQNEGIEVIHCDKPIYSISEQWSLHRLIPKDIDILWSPHYNIPLLYQGKLLVTIHDVFHLAMPELIGGTLKHLYAWGMFRLACAKADSIITPSLFTQREISRLLDYSKATVIPNGVDDIWYKEATRQSVREKPYFIFVGNVKPHKNLRTLLKAYEQIVHHIPHDLIIVGKKEGFITGDQEVFEQAQSLGNRVVFTGVLPDSTLRNYVSQATALVFPSLYEGFGLPPLEAMACGCPVIASNYASIPEVCGKAALYVNPLDSGEMSEKLLEIAADRQLRSELVARGKEQVRNFSWDRSAELTTGVIADLL